MNVVLTLHKKCNIDWFLVGKNWRLFPDWLINEVQFNWAPWWSIEGLPRSADRCVHCFRMLIANSTQTRLRNTLTMKKNAHLAFLTEDTLWTCKRFFRRRMFCGSQCIMSLLPLQCDLIVPFPKRQNTKYSQLAGVTGSVKGRNGRLPPMCDEMSLITPDMCKKTFLLAAGTSCVTLMLDCSSSAVWNDF